VKWNCGGGGALRDAMLRRAGGRITTLNRRPVTPSTGRHLQLRRSTGTEARAVTVSSTKLMSFVVRCGKWRARIEVNCPRSTVAAGGDGRSTA